MESLKNVTSALIANEVGIPQVEGVTLAPLSLYLAALLSPLLINQVELELAKGPAMVRPRGGKPSASDEFYRDMVINGLRVLFHFSSYRRFSHPTFLQHPTAVATLSYEFIWHVFVFKKLAATYDPATIVPVEGQTPFSLWAASKELELLMWLQLAGLMWVVRGLWNDSHFLVDLTAQFSR